MSVLVDCISVEYYDGYKYNTITKRRSPGYKIGVTPADLVLKIRFPDGSEGEVPIKDHFKDYLFTLGRKNFSSKVLAAIRKSMPKQINVQIIGDPCICLYYEADPTDLHKWSANTVI